MKRGTLITIILAAIFAGILLYSTLSAQQVECSACVTFNGETNCATASAETAEAATKQAVTTACGTISKGMDESIRCANTPPTRPQCRNR
ncbi:MAG TPA: hypothetical protein VM764_05355 [Gemmatimonadaceae bacterium]|jgi:hypothetical protein|nr:hypothetical protein [Gemmatimonadaceae bacterium]